VRSRSPQSRRRAISSSDELVVGRTRRHANSSSDDLVGVRSRRRAISSACDLVAPPHDLVLGDEDGYAALQSSGLANSSVTCLRHDGAVPSQMSSPAWMSALGRPELTPLRKTFATSVV
jgi:hypothetical protein